MGKQTPPTWQFSSGNMEIKHAGFDRHEVGGYINHKMVISWESNQQDDIRVDQKMGYIPPKWAFKKDKSC